MQNFQVFEISGQDDLKLNEIGKFRLKVWREASQINEDCFPNGEWTDPLDLQGRHWIVKDSMGLIASARLTLYPTLEECGDSEPWIRANRALPAPIAQLSRLVVDPRGQRQGIGLLLNRLRVEAAKSMGARSVIGIASQQNSRLLERIGFVDTGARESFDHLQGTEFRALEQIFH